MINALILLFAILLILYFIYGFLRRKTTVGSLHQKAVLITGCRGGFGKDLVKRCLQNGLTVFAGCHRECSVAELEESCGVTPGQLFAFHMDVTSDESVKQSRIFIDKIIQEKKLVLHALVNNAGIRGINFYDDFLNLDDYRTVWDVNTLGVIRVTHTFRDLIKQSRGRIVICSSCATVFSLPSYGPYGTSKSAVEKYADIIRNELKPFGVQVIVLQPGSFDTDMQNVDRLLNRMDSVWKRSSQKTRDEFGTDYIVKAKKFAHKMQLAILSKNISWVTDAYYEAIVSERPKLLYRVGWDMLLFFYPYSLLPLRVQHYLMEFLSCITDAPLPEKGVKKAN